MEPVGRLGPGTRELDPWAKIHQNWTRNRQTILVSSILIETHPLCLIVRPKDTAPSCPTAIVWTTTFSKGPHLLEVLHIFEEGGVDPPTRILC